MDLQLGNKTALVVAASKGIGKAAALALAREGCRVVIASSNERNLEAAAGDIRNVTGSAVGICLLDVTSAQSVDAAATRVMAEHGKVDILFANGPGPRPMDAMALDTEALMPALQANLFSVVHLCRRLLPGMVQRRFGRIINLSSSVAKEPDVGMVLSGVARAGVLAYAKTLSREVAVHGITVNSLLTGSVLTDRTRDLMVSEAKAMKVEPEQYLEQAAQGIPAGYISTPEQFSHIVAFLASPLSMYITGVSIPVDGGVMRAV